jgi:hypothetical protein
MNIFPKFSTQRKKEICSNAREVLEQINKAFPHETYQSIANRAAVHVQTIQRWSSVGRAEAFAIRRLISSLANEEILDSVLLKDASPAQLKKQCQIVGWDKVIKA